MKHRIRAALILLLLVVSSGCATTKEVQEIVSQTNVAMISGGTIGQKNGTGSDKWKEESARIDAFIEANPDSDVTNAALRVRQGMLLAIHKQDAYALMAFEQIRDRDQLVSARDRALYDLHEHIVWWFNVSEGSFEGTPSTLADKEGGGDYKKAFDSLVDFVRVCDGLPLGSSIRSYLEEMRAWIAATYANDVTVQAIAQEAFENGLNRYAAQFSDDDLKWLSENLQTDPDDLPFLRLKHRLRAKTVVKQYRKVESDQELSVDPLNSKAKALLYSIP